jgi:biopolymer transport protein ExbD
MVDVVLVLLVIMMVSSTYIVSQSLKVELPTSGSSDAPAAAPAMVTVTKDGSYMFNQKAVKDDDELSALLRGARGENPDASIVISADTASMHGKVIHAIDLAKQAGITKFAIGVQRE